MFDGAISPTDMYGQSPPMAMGGLSGELRPPRIIAPLQHLFDPIVGADDFYRPSQWWGELPVPVSRFSIAPRIAFDRLPSLPENLAEAMLYHLQIRLIEGTLYIRHSLPELTFGHPAIDGEVTLLH
jgi:hypothetical protein